MTETTIKRMQVTVRRVGAKAIIEWLIVICLAFYMGFQEFPKAWRTLNTDFPNYYLTARLVQEGVDTSRVYEWLWIQRQKDHRGIDQRVVGLVPITPFSTLVVRPLTSFEPLTAKRLWLIFNLLLLAQISVLVRSITRMAWRRIALVIGLNFPLYRNLLYGQYYILLSYVLVLACWLYLRRQRFKSGLLIGLGFGLKIFPILYLLYFLKKRDYRSFAGGVVGCIVVAAASVGVFGWELNRQYVSQILPWALRGEGLNPYNLTTSSFAALLHRLFIYEPQWNPHPVRHAPWLFALLHPIFQLLIIGPALLVVSGGATSSRQTRLAWAGMLLAILTISTMPGSYVFTLLILPVCVLWKELDRQKRPLATGILLILYFTAAMLPQGDFQGFGWQVLAGVPRLYALIGLCCLSYHLLWPKIKWVKWFGQDEMIWLTTMGFGLLVAIFVGLHHQRGLYDNYALRIPMPPAALMVMHPVVDGDTVSFVAMRRNGYQVGSAINSADDGIDQMGVTATRGEQFIEQVGHRSNIVSAQSRYVELFDAEAPIISPDGRWLAFLREDHGHARLWVHAIGKATTQDRPLTPTGANVFEATFLSQDELAFAGEADGKGPQLFSVDMAGTVRVLQQERTRFPAGSPDKKWLAYSRLERGYWNLWIQERASGYNIRITDAECNSVEPVWSDDSTKLIYASDCGRALWFTALCERSIRP